jgi:hypothetical protein
VSTLTLKADIRDLTRQLSQIPGITAGEAQKMTIALEKELKKQTKLAQDAARASAVAVKGQAQATTTSLGQAQAAAFSLQQQLLDVGTSLTGGASPLTVLAQQGPQIATALAQGGGAAATFRAALAPLAGAAAAAGTALAAVAVVVAAVAAAGSTLARAWVDANEATLRAEEQAQALTVALEAARLKSAETAAGIRAIGSAATEAETSLGVLVGELDRYSVEADKAQAAARRQAEAALTATGRELELTRQRLAGLEAEQAAASRSITGLETYGERQAQIEQTTARVRDLEAQLAAGRAGLARQNDAIALAAEYRREEAEANEVLRKREEGVRAAKEATAEATRRQREEEAQRRKEADEAARAAQARATAEGSLVDAFRQARFEAASAEEQVALRLAETTAEIDAQIEAAGFSATAFQYGEAAKVQAALNAEAQITAIRKAAADEESQRLARQRQEYAELQASRYDAAAQLAGGLAALAEGAARAEAGRNRQAALAAFRVAKGLRVAESTMNGLQAITAIQARWAANPVLAGVLTGATVATTAATIGTILATKPTFDRGGIVTPGTGDQVTAQVLPGEAVLNRQATASLGESGVRALNSGQGMGTQIVVTPVLDTGRWVRAELARPSVLARALRPAAGSGRRGY